jgi:hypothetical protein
MVDAHPTAALGVMPVAMNIGAEQIGESLRKD